MQNPPASDDPELPQETAAFYHRALSALNEADVPFVVGGAYAFAKYSGIVRHTKDFDVFVMPEDVHCALEALASIGCITELSFPHWLGKGICGEDFVDVIFRSGNGVCEVDQAWFEYAVEDEVFGVQVKLCPAEEIIWTKAYVMERERFDGADIAHILRAHGERLDWKRLLARFGSHWRVLFSHLILFPFIYPAEGAKIPDWVIEELLGRLRAEREQQPLHERVCHGTLLSRAQYLIDTLEWGYEDARLRPRGTMTEEEVARWTAAIAEDGPSAH